MCSCHRYLSKKDVDAAVQEVTNEHSCRQVEADPQQRPHAATSRREDGLKTVSGHGARRAGGGPEQPAVLYPTRPHGLVVGHGGGAAAAFCATGLPKAILARPAPAPAALRIVLPVDRPEELLRGPVVAAVRVECKYPLFEEGLRLRR